MFRCIGHSIPRTVFKVCSMPTKQIPNLQENEVCPSLIFLACRPRRIFRRNCSTLLSELRMKILLTGPITVYEYMKEVLTNPLLGYYTRGVMFSDGDFVTSPEISQVFGELIGVWIVNEWYKMGAPKPFQLVELGPGTGSLMLDIMRSLNKLKLEKSDFRIHLVEKSLQLSKLQEEKLCKTSHQEVPSDLKGEYKSSITTSGQEILWHYHVDNIPKQFSFFIANEFFDALPIHKFKKTKNGWREILVDIEENGENLRFVLASIPTPASAAYVDPREVRDEVEVSPDSAVIFTQLAERIKEKGGATLVIDYGHEGTLTDTLRAFKGQKQLSPLYLPGNCDVTADVDFLYLKRNAPDTVLCLGPISQRLFLKNLGIEVRYKILYQNCDKALRSHLEKGYQILMDPEQMGERFKVMALLPKTVEDIIRKYPVAGF